MAVDRAQPLVVVTAWRGFGLDLGLVLLACLAVGAVAQAAVVSAARVGRLSLPQVRLATYGGAGLAALAMFAWPVVFSSDVYAYAAYGDLALRGFDPYVHPPTGAGDALVRAAAWQWGGSFPVCVYGPAFVAFASEVVALTRGLPPAVTLLAFRLAAVFAFGIALAALDIALAGRRAADRATGLATVGLHPVLLWSAVEGHNDALVLAAVLVAAALARLDRSRAVAGGLLAGGSLLLKVTGIPGAVALGLAVRARRRVNWPWYAPAAAAALAASLAAGAPGLIRAAHVLREHGRYAPQGSLVVLTGSLAAWTAAAVVATTGAALLWRGRLDGLAWAAAGCWLALPNPYPWYAFWIVPAAALAQDAGVRRTVTAATILIAVRYLPDADGYMSSGVAVVLSALAVSPFLLFAARVRPSAAEKAALRP